MKKTNVMIEVPEDVYDEVVVPFKQKKSFGKLVAQLLCAYYSNDSIYSYINGTFDELENEATEELLKDLNSMTQSLGIMGMFASQAEAVIENGQKEFEEVGSRTEKDIKEYSSSLDGKGVLTREDVKDIVNESISDIRDMLQSILSGGAVKEVRENVVEETKVSDDVYPTYETRVDSENVFVEEVNTSSVDDVEDEVYPSEEEERKASEALASLMGSLGF